MDEQRKEDGSNKPSEESAKSTQEKKKGRLMPPIGILAAVDACLIHYRLAMQELDLTMAFRLQQSAGEEVIETLRRFKGYLEERASQLEKGRVPWATENLVILQAIWDMDEEAISNLPEETRDVFREVREKNCDFNEDREHVLRVIESNNHMLKALTNVLWELRWEDEERAEFLLERLQNIETGPSRGDNLVFMAELLTRK